MRGCGSSYQCRESVWLCDFRMVLTGMWSRGWAAVSPKYFVPAINIVFLVFILADCTLEKQTLDSGKLDVGLVSAGSNDIEP